MKRFLIIVFLITYIMSVSCTNNDNTEVVKNDTEITLNEQTLYQLGVLEATIQETSENINPEKSDKEEYNPINYNKQSGMWFTYMEYQDILYNKTESEFTESIKSRLVQAAQMGINTVYIHVRAFNDCCYKSDIFPQADYYSGNYDALEITLNEAHKLGLSVHAWLNPLRCQTDEQMKKLDTDFQIKKWYDDSKKNGTYIVKLENRWYLNPAYDEVREYIASGAAEIVRNYHVDGIHIDDYFYPTSETEFDADAFSESGSSDLDKWRIENINLMVSSIYDAVKKENKEVLFGISPQGNIDSNYSSQYADVKTWVSKTGYCDYIVPQIYYGFKNESCPFEKTVKKWVDLNTCKDISLVIGLGAYKVGNEDKWAGSGKNEWIEDKDIISKQAEYAAKNDLGIAIYSYDSTFSEKLNEERSDIAETVKKYYGGEQS